MKKLSNTVLVTACCYSSLAAAQQTFDLNEIQVTASRVAQTVDETLASVTLITRSDIERSQAVTVAEILQKTPGVMITNSGGIGKSSSIYLRGTSTKDLLILVDGIRIGSATLGQVSVEDLNLSQIERIEIVRGPRSSLYGSDAAGGVIQLFTRRGKGKLTPSFTVSSGSDSTSLAEAGLQAGDQNRWFNVTASGITTDGFDAKTTGDSDKDGYHNKAFQLKLGQRFNKGHELEGLFSFTHADNEYDGYADRSKTLTKILGGRGTIVASDVWRVNLSAGRSLNDVKTLSGDTFSSRYETIRDSFSVQNELLIGEGDQLIFGVDYLNDQIEASKVYAETERTNWAGFTQYQLISGRSDLQLSLRVDDNEQFGQHSTGGIAWGVQLSDEINFIASYGTAFKAPSFNDLYYPGSGNDALQPEESATSELSLRGKSQGINWQTSLYETTFENMIAWAPVSPGSYTWAPSNINSARIRGLELGADYQWQLWRLSANASFIDSENRSGVNKGKRLQRRADRLANMSIDRDFGAFALGATVHGEGRRYANASNTRSLAGFGTVDLRATYQLSPSWQIRAKLSNLLNKQYQTVSDYNQSGATGLFTLAYRPQ